MYSFFVSSIISLPVGYGPASGSILKKILFVTLRWSKISDLKLALTVPPVNICRKVIVNVFSISRIFYPCQEYFMHAKFDLIWYL